VKKPVSKFAFQIHNLQGYITERDGVKKDLILAKVFVERKSQMGIIIGQGGAVQAQCSWPIACKRLVSTLVPGLFRSTSLEYKLVN
jgi:hypothetical protein